MKISIGGFLLTALMFGIGNQWLVSSAVPGPARPYALASLGIAAFSLIVSTLIMGKLVGVRTLAQWVRALLAVVAAVAAAVALLALPLLLRGE